MTKYENALTGAKELWWKVTWKVQISTGWRWDDAEIFSEFLWATDEHEARQKVVRKIRYIQSSNYRPVIIKVEMQS